MNRTHQTFSEQEKDKLLREVKNFFHVFAAFRLRFCEGFGVMSRLLPRASPPFAYASAKASA